MIYFWNYRVQQFQIVLVKCLLLLLSFALIRSKFVPEFRILNANYLLMQV
jgi:hypothetical protein